MIEFTLFGVGFAASAVCAVLVWRKVPLLLQVPPQLVEESFVTRPSRLKRVVDRIVEFFCSEEYRDFYYRATLFSLKGLRLWLLRVERATFRVIEALESDSREWSRERQQYWSSLKQWKTEGLQNGDAKTVDAIVPSSHDESRDSSLTPR